MQRYSFATIITVNDGLPIATHLPFIVKEVNGEIVLTSHFAKANPQASGSIHNKVLVIFTEPHAYISPKHYEKEASVPTWNYIAVHACGNCFLIDSEENKAALLKEMIQYYEADYQKQWDSQSDTFKRNMMNGIVAFKIVVDALQGKKKLSQNKTVKERTSIISELKNAQTSNEKDLAAYMESSNSDKLQ